MKFGIELLVIALAVLQSLGFILTYILAVYYNHVNPGFPYISDTGGHPPESCVFTLICSISAILTLLIMYIRFQHVHQYYSNNVTKVKVMNLILFCIGLLSVLGFLLVGAFQDSEVLTVHLIGAMMVFGFGVLYMWLQTLLSYRIYHASLTRHVSSIVIAIRLILSILATLFFIIVIVSQEVAKRQRNAQDPNFDNFHWTYKNAGYPMHMVSTISEWLLGVSFLLYFLTFHIEFSRIEFVVSIGLRYGYLSISESTPLTV